MKKQKLSPLRMQSLDGFCSGTSFDFRTSIGDVFCGKVDAIIPLAGKDGAVKSLKLKASWLVRVTDGGNSLLNEKVPVPIKNTYIESYVIELTAPLVAPCSDPDKLILIAGSDRLELNKSELVLQAADHIRDLALEQQQAA